MNKLLAAAAFSVFLAGPALADEVLLTNDSQIDGITAGYGNDNCCADRSIRNDQDRRNQNNQVTGDNVQNTGNNATGGNYQSQ